MSMIAGCGVGGGRWGGVDGEDRLACMGIKENGGGREGIGIVYLKVSLTQSTEYDL